MFQFLESTRRKDGGLWFFNFSILLQDGALQISVVEVVDSGEVTDRQGEVTDRQASQGKKYIVKFILEQFCPTQMM